MQIQSTTQQRLNTLMRRLSMAPVLQCITVYLPTLSIRPPIKKVFRTFLHLDDVRHCQKLLTIGCTYLHRQEEMVVVSRYKTERHKSMREEQKKLLYIVCLRRTEVTTISTEENFFSPPSDTFYRANHCLFLFIFILFA